MTKTKTTKDNPLVKFDGILDILYAFIFTALFSYAITIYNLSPLSGFFDAFKPGIIVTPLQLAAFFILFIYIFEDYHTVKLISSVHNYQSSSRYSIDVLILTLLFLSAIFLLRGNAVFLLIVYFVNWLSRIWCIILRRFEKFDHSFVYITRITHDIAIWLYSICIGYMLIKTMLFDEELNLLGGKIFDQALNIFIAVNVLSFLWLLVLKIFFILGSKLEFREADDLIRNSGPFTSKLIVYLITFSVYKTAKLISRNNTIK